MYDKIKSTDSFGITKRRITMKKLVSLALVCIMLLGSVFALSSCGKIITGKYEADITAIGTGVVVTYEFSGLNKVTVTSKAKVLGFSSDAVVVTGTYEIGEDEDGDTTITFDYDEDKKADGAEKEGVAVPFARGEEDGTKYIKIGGVKFEKVTD